jgi:purine-cytosine permease-like protein
MRVKLLRQVIFAIKKILIGMFGIGYVLAFFEIFIASLMGKLTLFIIAATYCCIGAIIIEQFNLFPDKEIKTAFS